MTKGDLDFVCKCWTLKLKVQVHTMARLTAFFLLEIDWLMIGWWVWDFYSLIADDCWLVTFKTEDSFLPPFFATHEPKCRIIIKNLKKLKKKYIYMYIYYVCFNVLNTVLNPLNPEIKYWGPKNKGPHH